MFMDSNCMSFFNQKKCICSKHLEYWNCLACPHLILNSLRNDYKISLKMSTSSPDQVWNIEKFDGSNHQTWKIHLSYLLKRERLWDLVMGVELKPQNIVSTDGIITDRPPTGLGPISNWEDKDRIAQMLIVESVKNVCLGHAWSCY